MTTTKNVNKAKVTRAQIYRSVASSSSIETSRQVRAVEERLAKGARTHHVQLALTPKCKRYIEST